MASFRLDLKLKAFIDEARGVEDLIGIFKHVPLQRVKDLAKQHVQSIRPEELRSLFHKSCPIDSILSTDAMQSMLSFLPHQHSLKSVNKHFNRLVHNNAAISKRARERNIASQFKGTNVWLVDPARDSLNADETQKGIKGPVESLQKALNCIESGDKILLAEGRHFFVGSLGEKDVRIQGIGKCEISGENNETRDAPDIFVASRVSMSNIRIQDGSTSVMVKEKGTLWMTCSVFRGDFCGISVRKSSKLDLRNVQFINVTQSWAIGAAAHSSISAFGCLFDDCGCTDEEYPCIALNDAESESVSLHLVGNVFKNLPTTPIGVHSDACQQHP